MDGKGRALDNVFIERFWRSLKQEKIYRMDLISVQEAKNAITEYIEFYNNHRLHQSLDYQTPAQVHCKGYLGPIDRRDKISNSHNLSTATITSNLKDFNQENYISL